MQHVAGMTGIALFDLDSSEARRRTTLMVPDAFNIRQAAGFQCTPDFGGARNAFQQAGFVDRFVLRRAADDRFVAMQDRLDFDIGTRHRVIRVIPHPFAERAFLFNLARPGYTFDGNFGIGGNWEAGIRAGDTFDGFTAQATSKIKLADAFRKRAR